jgi:hypothetical protein
MKSIILDKNGKIAENGVATILGSLIAYVIPLPLGVMLFPGVFLCSKGIIQLITLKKSAERVPC